MTFDSNRKKSEHGTDKAAWIMVGSTGVGKSSLINLFSNSHVSTSGGSNSCSKEVKLYLTREEYGKLPLIDTIGCQDSDGLQNEDIMSRIFRFIHSKSLDNVKIIWIINPEIKCTSELQDQSKFINYFRETAIWGSVLIVVKFGTPNTVKNKSQGAVAAINRLNISDEQCENIPKLGYKCIDWLSEDEKLDIADFTTEQLIKRNILSECDIRQLVLNAMNTLPPCQVLFNNQKCVKCGQIGDRRIFPAQCHLQMEYYHPQGSVFVHKSGSTAYRHTMPGVDKHKGKLIEKKYHDGKIKQKYRIWTERYHPDVPEWYHSGHYEEETGARVVLGILSFGTQVANQDYWTCCYQHGSGSDGCRKRWKCCGGGPSSTGCESKQHKIYEYDYWSCCSSVCTHGDKSGCKVKIYWDCCNAEGADAQECDKYYECCDRFELQNQKHVQCKEYHTCCNEYVGDSDGCVLACCKQDRYNINSGRGCQQRCVKCKKAWNDATVEGCGVGKQFEHQIEDI